MWNDAGWLQRRPGSRIRTWKVSGPAGSCGIMTRGSPAAGDHSSRYPRTRVWYRTLSEGWASPLNAASIYASEATPSAIPSVIPNAMLLKLIDVMRGARETDWGAISPCQ